VKGLQLRRSRNILVMLMRAETMVAHRAKRAGHVSALVVLGGSVPPGRFSTSRSPFSRSDRAPRSNYTGVLCDLAHLDRAI